MSIPQIGEVFNPFNRFNISPIPEEISRYRGITAGAKLIYGRLCRYAGENGKAFPAVETLAEECGMSGSQARIHLKELTAAHLLNIIDNPGKTRRYEFVWHAAFKGDTGAQRKTFTVRNSIRPLQLSVGVPLQLSGPPPLQITVDEESHHQESQLKESQASPASPSKVPTLPEIKSTAKPSQNGDDEKPKSKPSGDGEVDSLLQGLRDAPRPASDHEARELTRQLIAIGKESDVDNAVSVLGRKLNDRDGLWIDYWEKAKLTGSPLKVAGGHYTKLAKNLVVSIEVSTIALRTQRMAALTSVPEPKRAPRVCKAGRSCTEGRLPDGDYCTCEVGDLARYVYGSSNESLMPPASEPPKGYSMAGAA